jgi:hypothetical protein
MSWDIYVQDLPATAISTDDIPDDFRPRPLGSRQRIIASILKIAPFSDVSNPSWIRIDGHGADLEVSLGDDEIVEHFVIHVRSGEASIGVIAAVLEDLGYRALDPQAETGIFDPAAAASGLARWLAYRDRVIGQ